MYVYQLHRVVMFLFTLLLVACGGGGESGEAPAVDATDSADASGIAPDLSQSGNISGKVNFEGEQPQQARIRMGAEPHCEHKHSGAIYSQAVVVNDNSTLKNAFVWVKGGMEKYKFPVPSEPARLDQEGCLYSPHVLGVQAGQDIQITNSDEVTHNIHPVPQQNREWNISQSSGQELSRSFPRSEIMVPVKCNVHPWMVCYIGVVAHPYFAVTGDDGTFELNNVPPGEYTIETWHERYGTQEQTVTVGPSESKEIEFSYSG